MRARLSKLLAVFLLLWFPAFWPAPPTSPQPELVSMSVGQPTDWHAVGQAIRAREAWYAALRPPASTPPAPQRSGPVTTPPPAPPVTYEQGTIRALICSSFGDACRPAVTVALCESTLRADAVNGPNRGVFQINQVHADQWAAVTGVDYWSSWMDPVTNISFAHWLYEQSGWGPWSCKP